MSSEPIPILIYLSRDIKVLKNKENYSGSVENFVISVLNKNISVLKKEGIINNNVEEIIDQSGLLEEGNFSKNIIKRSLYKYSGKIKLIKALCIALYGEQWKEEYLKYYDKKDAQINKNSANNNPSDEVVPNLQKEDTSTDFKPLGTSKGNFLTKVLPSKKKVNNKIRNITFITWLGFAIFNGVILILIGFLFHKFKYTISVAILIILLFLIYWLTINLFPKVKMKNWENTAKYSLISAITIFIILSLFLWNYGAITRNRFIYIIPK